MLPAVMGVGFSFLNIRNVDFSTATFAGIGNYKNVLTDSGVNIAIKNSFIFAFVTTVLKVTLGLLLAVLLRPLGNVDLSAVSLDLSAYRQTVERRQAELEQEGQKELVGLIEAELESYIWDKAADMGLTLRVQVTVEPDGSGVPVPVSVELTGPRSEVLSRWLETELGVPAERQVWNEN